MDRSQLTLLALCDVSAAFDMADMVPSASDSTSCGILWLKSYLSGRIQMVICGDTRTPWVLVKHGVPQGSVLVLSFTCYVQPIFQPYSPNIPQLVNSMLMMCRRSPRRSSMVHLLISLLLVAALMLS